MKRHLAAILIPPWAACRYGCSGCCAAPIGVFWLTAIVSLVYGALGGPLGLAGTSWGTLGLGVVLWAIATTWTLVLFRSVDDDRCAKRASPLCSRIAPREDETDPLDEIRKTG